MHLSYRHQKNQRDFASAAQSILIGRLEAGVKLDLDLTPDLKVSRVHARLFVEDGQYWIEDLESKHGTRINNEEIKGKGSCRLNSSDVITIGETELRLIAGSGASPQPSPDPEEAPPALDGVTPILDANTPALDVNTVANLDAARRLALLYELPLQFGKETRLEALLQLIVERVISVISGAQRGALLVKDRSGRLALKAHMPVGRPAVSLNLAQRAMDQRSAFVWPPPVKQMIPDSVGVYKIRSAMYAPLLWRDRSFGVVCVDNESGSTFSADDLQLLQAVAHHAAMAVANLDLFTEQQQQMEVLNNMLKLVSPQIAERLKQRGQVRLGGDFRDVTILIADIRGFTNLSATMSPHEVTQMLEDYFGALVPLVFKYQGTVDKYVGDAILAVFGSPDPDEEQHIHAAQAALEMQSALKEVNAKRTAQGKQTGELGIGIHSGEVVHGLIGTPERMEYTVIGDTVNRASRYCDGADKGEVLISADLYQWIWNRIEAEQTSIATKHEGNLTAYRVKRLR
jgi:adenylate cyclase